MKSILHLKDDTEYQIPLREKDDRAKVGTTDANPEVKVEKEDDVEKVNNEKEAKQVKATATQSQGELPDAQKSKNDQSKADSEAAKEDKKETDEISQEEVNNENDPALDNLEEENPNQEHPNTEESNSDTNTESMPQVDTAKAALDEMKKLASQEGVIHPSLFISNFSKILGLMERAMQLQVKESGSATKESGSVTKEAPKSTEQAETPAEGK